MTRFLQSNAPAMRARRSFWIKQLVVLGWTVSWLALGVIFEKWLTLHVFISVLLAIFAGVTMIAFGAAWRFAVPCPRCGWNINMPKDMWRPQWTIPSVCQNCGQDLRVEV
jgi:hypothetical protein